METQSMETAGVQEVAATLRSLGSNAVVYSEAAWASARKSSSGGPDGIWFPDQGSHSSRSLSPLEMSAWASDWTVLRRGEGR